MSRMTKYLKQKCTYEKMKFSRDGEPLFNRYGDPLYEAPIEIRCRREDITQEIQTSTGSILKSGTRYLTDDKQKIQTGDRLNGKAVIKVQSYINQFGAIEGFESYV